MGMFSWFTQDTHHRIVADEPYKVVMTDNNSNKYVETCYEGYGVFGGKDFYELVAEMNGYALLEKDGKKYLCKIEKEVSMNYDLRNKGIELAFDGYPYGDNPNIIYPSITENGKYMDGACPEEDPDQGFYIEENEDDDNF